MWQSTIKAINQYSVVNIDNRKAFQNIFAASLLLYSRSNYCFSPNIFCKPHHSKDDLDVSLRGDEEVEFFSIPSIINHPVSPEDFESFVSRLTPISSGAVIVPQFELNSNGDVFGLFKTSEREDHWTFLVFHYKDDSIDQWKQVRNVLFPQSEINFTVETKSQTVKIFHIMICDDDSEETYKLESIDMDGVGTISTMRMWLPTAAYAFESARKFREMSVETTIVEIDYLL
jgi:hypothetical protein